MEKPSFFAILPANVRYDKRLKPMEKILYAEITSLAGKEGYCYAKNSYFAEVFEVSKTVVINWINNLTELGYLKTEIVYFENTKQVKERRIYIISTPSQEKLTTPSTNVDHPSQEKLTTLVNKSLPHNNININNTSNNNYIYIFKGNEEFKNLFDEFIQQRKIDEQKEVSQLQHELYQKNLYELSNGDVKKAIEILKNTIMNRWKKFYKLPKEEEGNGNKKFSGYGKRENRTAKRKLDYSTSGNW